MRMLDQRSVAMRLGWLMAALALAVTACGNGEEMREPVEAELGEEETAVSLELMSTAIDEGAPIPVEFTCDGDNLSPPLNWTGVPPGTRSLALVVDDPDAPRGTWVHWVVYDIPRDVVDLPEALPDDRELPFGARHGTNDFKNLGYGGPCPPPGGPHRYFFKLYALDRALNLEPGSTKQELLSAMEGHILAEGQLMGSYQRR